ncbi:lipid A phosphoethanolamine transferase, partial [Acinetobacter baumannii]
VNCLRQQTKQKLSQDNLFTILLSLLDVKTQVVNNQLDMLSQFK